MDILEQHYKSIQKHPLFSAYVAAFDEYARNSSEISLVAELEIPPSGAFGRGAWTAKDQQVVDRIIDSARIANEQGELVNFDRSG